MKEIDPKTINNAAVTDAVLTKVIPLLNKLVEEVTTLRAEVDRLTQGEEADLNGLFNDVVSTALTDAGYKTLGDLEGVDDETLLALDGIGQTRLDDIRAVLDAINIE